MDSDNAPQLTVVIADDSPTLRKIVGTVLERDGMRTVHAEDGDVFLADYGPLGTVGCRFERAPG